MTNSKPQVVVVTGASAGVGRATVREFARRGAKIGLLASYLMNQVDRMVIDETGLTGSYEFDLQWTPDAPPKLSGEAPADTTGPTLFSALQDQLGLKLESKRRPVPAVIIEHIERPSEN